MIDTIMFSFFSNMAGYSSATLFRIMSIYITQRRGQLSYSTTTAPHHHTTDLVKERPVGGRGARPFLGPLRHELVEPCVGPTKCEVFPVYERRDIDHCAWAEVRNGGAENRLAQGAGAAKPVYSSSR